SQISSSLQRFPQTPQLSRSLSVSPQRLATHSFPSRCSLGPQRTGCPCSQISSSRQLTSQPPQLLRSLSMLVSHPSWTLPLQFAHPGWQEEMSQEPWRQDALA